ncbi:meiotic recombination protein REC114 isoform X4 [Centropristis striata]|uniref:meiotic recombination protein REC114 isoform X4 n=1 Tax=Centropristis striata TaxID=184440 RepID=UPI0027E1DC1D|nr:meiotic recombination protein REC114 isoform X4 [Centropristis striata]
MEVASSQAWRLKRYGRFVPGSDQGKPWKVFEANGDKPAIFLRIVESGYLLVLQGEESLDTIPLVHGSDFLKVHQKSDNLMFRFTVKEDAPVPPNPTPAEVSAPAIQTWQGKAVGVEPEVVQGSLSIKRLTKHMLGETAVTLPQVYRHGSLAQGDLETIVRLCLLDPSFPAFVEKVERELRKVLQE